MKSFLSKHAFWVFQILGCAIFTFVTYLIIGVSGIVYERVLFLTAMFLAYFIPTTILRFLYKYFVKTDPFEFIDLIKIVLFLVIVIVLGKELPYYLGYLAAKIVDLFGVYRELEIDLKIPKRTGIWQYVGHAIIFMGWTVFYFMIKELRKHIASRIARLELKDQIKQANLNTLKGHLNPQFMITSLTMIKELMLVDISKSRELLTKLSEILRYSLTKNNINSVSLDEELEIVKNYVNLLNLHDFEKFQVIYDIDTETLQNNVPPMLLTCLMELATKHGILKLKEGGRAVLTTKLKESILEIRLVHCGKISRSEGTEVLEKTIKQRLKLLFGSDAEYSSKHELNATTLLVNMPIAQENESTI